MYGIGHLLSPLEEVIKSKLTPALTGQPPPNEDVRQTRWYCPAVANSEFLASCKITEPLKRAILLQRLEYSEETISEQIDAKAQICKLKQEESKHAADSFKEQLPSSLQRSMSLAQKKGASSWLTSLPIQEFGFALHKGAFQDALALRYDCACGKKFSVEHALSCPKGGFPSIRHNEIRDLTADLLTEICNDVCVEPELQGVDGEQLNCASSNVQDGARLDIAANGFWGGRYECNFFDVRVFNPLAPSNRHTRPASCYHKHEMLKKRAYEQRVREIEHASFTPLGLSVTGGMANEATAFYKRLTCCLATKWDQPYSSTMSWLRCRLYFGQLYNVSEVHVPAVVMLPSPRPLLWTWLTLNLTSFKT